MHKQTADLGMNGFVAGIGYLLDGFKLIFKPGVRRFVIIPVFINFAVFICLFFLLQHYMGEFNAWIIQFLPVWLHWFAIILWILFFISFFLLFIFTFVTLANLIASPFNSLLSEKVELLITGKQLESKTWLAIVRDVPRTIVRQAKLLGYYLIWTIFILILFFVPIIQTIAAILWFLFNAWMMTLTYVDYPADNHRVAVAKMRSQLMQKRWVSLGFGMSVLIGTMVPILNFFIISAAVAGATKFWVEGLQ